METTGKIVEAYMRYVKHCLTIPNIKCDGQFEIDLLAVRVGKSGVRERFHVESGVSISGAYSRLTNKPYSEADRKNRIKQAGQRRTLGYFVSRKFGSQQVKDKLREYGFVDGNYSKIIITWDCDADVESEARKHGITILRFWEIMKEISETCDTGRTYYTGRGTKL